MNYETPGSKPGLLAKGFQAIVLAIIIAALVMIVGGVLGVILQIMFEPVLGTGARAFAFLSPVAVVAAWVYAKYYTLNGTGTPKQRPVALAGLTAFAVLMTIWFINEPLPSAHDPRKDAEALAKPCDGSPISKLGCVLNKEIIKRRQDSGQ